MKNKYYNFFLILVWWVNFQFGLMLNFNNYISHNIIISNRVLTQKKFYDKDISINAAENYSVIFNYKIKKVIAKSVNKDFTVKLSYLMGYNDCMSYTFDFGSSIINVDIASFVMLELKLRKYFVPKPIDLRSNFWYISQSNRYYQIDLGHKPLYHLMFNTAKVNIGKGSDILFRQKVTAEIPHSIEYYEFEWILATKDIVIFVEYYSDVLYICENNTDFIHFKRDFRRGFENYLYNNNFNRFLV